MTNFQVVSILFNGWRALPVIFISLYLLAGLIGPWIKPHQIDENDLRNNNLPPVSWSEDDRSGKRNFHLLGTDGRGRDVLSLWLASIRQPVLVTLFAAAVSIAAAWVFSAMTSRLSPSLRWVVSIVVALWLAPAACFAFADSYVAIMPFAVLSTSYASHLFTTTATCIVVAYGTMWIFLHRVRVHIMGIRPASSPNPNELQVCLGDDRSRNLGSLAIVTVVAVTLCASVVLAPLLQPSWPHSQIYRPFHAIWSHPTWLPLLALVFISCLWASAFVTTLVLVRHWYRKLGEYKTSMPSSDIPPQDMPDRIREVSFAEMIGNEVNAQEHHKRDAVGASRRFASILRNHPTQSIALTTLVVAVVGLMGVSLTTGSTVNTFPRSLDFDSWPGNNWHDRGDKEDWLYCTELRAKGERSDHCDERFDELIQNNRSSLSVSALAYFRHFALTLFLASLIAYVVNEIRVRLKGIANYVFNFTIASIVASIVVPTLLSANPLTILGVLIRLLPGDNLAGPFIDGIYDLHRVAIRTEFLLVAFSFSWLILLILPSAIETKNSAVIKMFSEFNPLFARYLLYVANLAMIACFGLGATFIFADSFPVVAIVLELHILDQWLIPGIIGDVGDWFRIIQHGTWIYWINVYLYIATIAVLIFVGIWIRRTLIGTTNSIKQIRDAPEARAAVNGHDQSR